MRILLILLVAVSALAHGGPKVAGPQVTTVILVRHAEKAGPSGDVQLSDAGVARANELARVLGDVKFDAIYTTPFHRTRNTAAPVAEKAGLKAIEVTADVAYGAQMARLVREKHAGGTVLIVGHSNTTRDVITALGGSIPEIADSQYDDLFIVTIVSGAPVKVLPLRYGAVKR